mmetsp:Transcript_4382/g.7813  ORF Transcript_4382/g.7813 Transcript_4382/m.7813 type:complete len:383 (+) Transcript_4382:4014-5162(+)
MHHAHENGHLHLQTVQVRQFRTTAVPNRIDTHIVRLRAHGQYHLAAVHGGTVAWIDHLGGVDGVDEQVPGDVMAAEVRLAKDAHGNGEELIVHESGENRVKTHHQDDVATAEQNREHISQILLRQLVFLDDQKGGERNEEDSVADIAEHDSEQKGKRHDGEHGGIDLAVLGDTVSFDNGLEGIRELGGAVVGRRDVVMSDGLHNGVQLRAALFGRLAEDILNTGLGNGGDPSLTDEHFAGHIDIQLVEGVVNGFFFQDEESPLVKIQGDGLEDRLAVAGAGLDGRLQLTDSSRHLAESLTLTGRLFRERIHVCAISLANLFNLQPGTLTGEKNDKNRLIDFLVSDRVHNLANGGLAEEHITTSGAEEKALKCINLIRRNGSR